MTNMVLLMQTMKTVFIDVMVDFLYTPVWWYSRGLWKQVKGVAGSVVARHRDLAIDVWLKNIGKPMYGQYDFWGRLISLFVRVAEIIGRFIVLLIWAMLCLGWLAVWALIPAGVVYLIYRQVTNFL